MTAHKNRVVLPGSERSARRGSRVVGAPDPNQQIKISVRVRPRQTLENLASANALTATPPHRRNYMSREQFAADYGANPGDLAKIEAFAHQHNLTVVEASQPRRTVVLAGTISALSAAFGVYLANYEHSAGAFRGRIRTHLYPGRPLRESFRCCSFGFDNRPAGAAPLPQTQEAAGPTTYCLYAAPGGSAL